MAGRLLNQVGAVAQRGSIQEVLRATVVHKFTSWTWAFWTQQCRFTTCFTACMPVCTRTKTLIGNIHVEEQLEFGDLFIVNLMSFQSMNPRFNVA